MPEKLHKKWEPVWFIHAKMRALYLLSKSLKFDERMQIVRYFDTFAFVRHPFVRLVSTFKDKILDKNYRHWRELVHFDKSNPLKVKVVIIALSHRLICTFSNKHIRNDKVSNF